MALGAIVVSPLEMAQAYAAFSNGGNRVAAYGIERIRTAAARVLYEQQAAAPRPGDRPTRRSAHEPDDAHGDDRRAPATRAAVPGYDLAGKTGTTCDYKDAWFVGYTGGFVTCVWVGRDDNKPMRRVTGGDAPAEIWRSFMTHGAEARADPGHPARPAAAGGRAAGGGGRPGRAGAGHADRAAHLTRQGAQGIPRSRLRARATPPAPAGTGPRRPRCV